MSLRRLPRATIFTYRHCVTMVSRMARRHGSGRSSSTAIFTCAPTTAKHPVGIRPLCGSGAAEFAGMTRDVSFEPAADALNDRVDDAYGIKYRNSRYLNSMTSRQARYATVKIFLCVAPAANAANVATGSTQGKPDD
jgi:hypothetical protein